MDREGKGDETCGRRFEGAGVHPALVPAPSDAGDAGARATAAVLIVDDEDAIHRALARTLRGEPYELVHARHAEAAEAVLRDRADVRAIVCDHYMPGTPGLDFLARVRHDRPDLVTVLLTAQADLAMVITAINEGRVHRFFTKPWDGDALRRALRTLLAGGESAGGDRRDVRSRSDSDLVGELVAGRYRVREVLGRGGMGTAYLADDERDAAKVVVKVPHALLLREPEFRARFERETESLKRVDHPHVVRVIHSGIHAEVPYVVLPYLSGGSLSDRIARRGGRLRVPDVLRWLPGMASALDAIHARGTLHRDVKPANILFDPHDHPFLADFGVAKVAGEGTSNLTQTGQAPGSPEYMAPEVIDARLGPAYDQYALGVVVYQALAARLPVHGDTPLAMLVRKQTELPVPLGEVAPTVERAIAAAVMRTLDRDPERRFPSCTAFAEALGDAWKTRQATGRSFRRRVPPSATLE